MDRSAIEKIVSLGAPNIVEKYGYEYTDKILNIIRVPQVETLEFKTLQGLIATLKAEHLRFDSPMIISVAEHNKIAVYSAINDTDRLRETPYEATAETPNFEYGWFMDYEQMMIALKSKFVETQQLTELVQLLGTITEENSAAISDDGFSQSVVVRKGIALKDNKVINPKVKLRPFRTFLDVEQPESEFLLRLKEGGYVALFEADGGAWKLEARANIADVLRVELSELVDKGTVIVVE